MLSVFMCRLGKVLTKHFVDNIPEESKDCSTLSLTVISLWTWLACHISNAMKSTPTVFASVKFLSRHLIQCWLKEENGKEKSEERRKRRCKQYKEF